MFLIRDKQEEKVRKNIDKIEKIELEAFNCLFTVPELEAALNMNDNDFKTNFNRPKPAQDTELIFHCMAGGRAKRCADVAQGLGFSK